MKFLVQKGCYLDLNGSKYHLLAFLVMADEKEEYYPVLQVQDVESEKILYLKLREDFLDEGFLEGFGDNFYYKIVEK